MQMCHSLEYCSPFDFDKYDFYFAMENKHGSQFDIDDNCHTLESGSTCMSLSCGSSQNMSPLEQNQQQQKQLNTEGNASTSSQLESLSTRNDFSDCNNLYDNNKYYEHSDTPFQFYEHSQQNLLSNITQRALTPTTLSFNMRGTEKNFMPPHLFRGCKPTPHLMSSQNLFDRKRKSNSIDLPVQATARQFSKSSNSTSFSTLTSERNAFANGPDDNQVDSWLEEFYTARQIESENKSDSFNTIKTEPRNQKTQNLKLGCCEEKNEEKRSQTSMGTKTSTKSSTNNKRKTKTYRCRSQNGKGNVKPRQRRIKWSVIELHQLWSGILEHGNEWREVHKNVSRRTYHQVKDKGRRLLQTESWVTGKTKKDTTIAKEVAKEIAQLVLQRYDATGKLSREDDSEPGCNKMVDDLLFPDLSYC